MRQVERILAQSEVIDVAQKVTRWELEKIVSTDQEGYLALCACKRVAVPGLNHCTACEP